MSKTKQNSGKQKPRSNTNGVVNLYVIWAYEFAIQAQSPRETISLANFVLAINHTQPQILYKFPTKTGYQWKYTAWMQSNSASLKQSIEIRGRNRLVEVTHQNWSEAIYNYANLPQFTRYKTTFTVMANEREASLCYHTRLRKYKQLLYYKPSTTPSVCFR